MCGASADDALRKITHDPGRKWRACQIALLLWLQAALLQSTVISIRRRGGSSSEGLWALDLIALGASQPRSLAALHEGCRRKVAV